MSSIQDVAEHAHVSISTVSRVLNNRPYVREAVRADVLEAAEHLGYTPRYTARRDNVLIVAAGGKNVSLGEYYSQLLTNLVRCLVREGFQFNVTVAGRLNRMSASFSQGVISTAGIQTGVAAVAPTKVGIPIVTLNAPVKGISGVYTDQKRGVRLAMDHLFEMKHECIGYFDELNPDENATAGLRFSQYQDSMRGSARGFDKSLVQTGKGKSILEAVLKLVNAGATALLCPGEEYALPVFHALHLLRKRVPEDISVITWENTTVSRYLAPPHTTIRQPLAEMAQMSVQMLQDVIGGERKPGEHVEIPSRLIERESVRDLSK